VLVREGDRVTRGTVLAEMEDWDYRGALASAEAKRNAALAGMNRALAANDGAEAGIQRVQADYWTSEVARARERLDHTKFRSPIDGVVATAHVEDMVGHHLAVGDPFAQVVDTSHAQVDVAIDASDVPLVRDGDGASVKVEGYPTQRFAGAVAVVSPMSTAEGDLRVFYARVDVPNPDGLLRPGMQGRGKVSVGWHPTGYVMFRGIGMWVWSKIWTWVGW
jgi:RND family efflux transporter MFP subunit